ncbi:hypothetical protein ACIRPK_26480 [Kitasatospora sp. NPDC101801]|uniref:hypothetical protein n=1 Tax=Kitasatospora sp. NPDC101801 TaxID=3364103 RepID=UPI0037FCB701
MTVSLLALTVVVSGVLLYRKQVRVLAALPLAGAGFFAAQTAIAPAVSELIASVASLVSNLAS